MIPADDNGGHYFPCSYQLIKGEPCLFPVALANPADPCGQSLEGNFLPRHFYPTYHAFICRKKAHHQFIGYTDVVRVAAKRGPAEGALAFAEHGPDICRHEARKIEAVAMFKFGSEIWVTGFAPLTFDIWLQVSFF